MADTMKYDLEVLQSKESQLTNIATDLLEVKRTLNQITETSDSYWQGPAREKFRKQSYDLGNKIAEQKTKIDTSRQNLTDAISIYRQTESKNEGTVSNLSTENIF